MEILLKNALVLSSSCPYKFSRKDVLIKDGKIAKIANSITANGAQKIDCSKKAAIPGLINCHTHSPMSLLRGLGDDLHLGDWLKHIMWPREKKLSESDIKTGAYLAIAEMLHSGTTTFNDHYFYMDSIADAAQSAGIRCALGYSMIDMGDAEGKGQSELKIAKEFAKKIISKKTNMLIPTINPHAPNTCSKKLLEESAALSKELNCHLHIHAAETREELAFTLKNYNMRPIQFLEACGCVSKNSILAHGVYASKSEIALAAKKGASVCHCPVANLKLASGGAAPIPQYIGAKANLALGTDGAASNNSLNMFETMKVGLIEQKNFHFDASSVKADDYLHMATAGGADALKINAGRLKEGTLADIALIGLNCANLVPFTNNAGWLAYSASPQNVSDVIINGKIVMQDKKILTFGEQEIFENAQKIADKIN